MDFVGEETNKFGTTEQIQNKLETILKEVILPETPFEIDARWSGIMGMGTKKTPLIQMLSSNIGCGIRLSGIGVAIGILVGEELARLVAKS